MKLLLRGRTLTFPRRPLVMGIVNLSADSFSGDGVATVDAAIERAVQQASDGADFIDIGAESARTNRGPISEEEEAARLLEFIARWPEVLARTPADRQPFLSINTWRPAVVRKVLPAGGDLLNDIGGLPTDENARICADHGAALLIMHSVGEPKVPHTHVAHPDVMEALDRFFSEKLALVEAAGLSRDATVLDPGIDFAKQREDNLRIYRELERLHRFARPILLPVSRKTVIGEVLDQPNAADRDPGTIACLVAGQLRGAQLFRVHNVRAAVQAVQVLDALNR